MLGVRVGVLVVLGVVIALTVPAAAPTYADHCAMMGGMGMGTGMSGPGGMMGGGCPVGGFGGTMGGPGPMGGGMMGGPGAMGGGAMRGCGRGPEPQNVPAPAIAELPRVAISITDSGFVPTEVTIPRGTVVVWTNTGSQPHTTTAWDRWDSGILRPGDSCIAWFVTPGSYDYLSIVAADGGRLTGTVNVLTQAIGENGMGMAPGTAPSTAPSTAPTTAPGTTPGTGTGTGTGPGTGY